MYYFKMAAIRYLGYLIHNLGSTQKELGRSLCIIWLKLLLEFRKHKRILYIAFGLKAPFMSSEWRFWAGFDHKCLTVLTQTPKRYVRVWKRVRWHIHHQNPCFCGGGARHVVFTEIIHVIAVPPDLDIHGCYTPDTVTYSVFYWNLFRGFGATGGGVENCPLAFKSICDSVKILRIH